MKKNLLSFLLLILIAVPVIAQKSETDGEKSIQRKDMPKVVLAAFAKSYPTATIKGYAMEKDGGKTVYEIESKDGKVSRDVLYNPDGVVIVVEESLPYSEVPQPVRDAVSKNYPDSKVARCEKLIRGSSTQFEVLLKSGKRKLELVYEPNGEEVEKEVK